MTFAAGKVFLKRNWMAALLVLAVLFLWHDYRGQGQKIAALETSIAHHGQALAEQGKINERLRADIEARSIVGLEHKERMHDTQTRSEEAKATLERDRTDWADHPYPDAVFDAARLLEAD